MLTRSHPACPRGRAHRRAHARITSFSRNGSTRAYNYDTNGNRLSAQTSQYLDLNLSGAQDPSDPALAVQQTLSVAATSNRLLGFSQTQSQSTGGAAPVTTQASAQINYSLDAAGNLTSDGLRVFSYNAANRLRQTTVNDPDEGSKITYLHNALGQRVFKSEPKVDHVAPNATALGTPFVDWLRINFGWLFAQAQLDPTLGQSYLYDDAQLGSTPILLAEYGNGSSSMDGRREYIWLPTQDGQAIAIALYRGVNFNAIHTDHLGTPRKVTNSNNFTDWQWPYSAFGETPPSGGLQVTTDPTQAYTTDTATATMLAVGPSPISFNFRFPGQYFDDESKLSYNYFRSYQASQGRYTQADPIGLSGGLNRFSYAESNAMSNIDPQGLFVPANHNGITAAALRIAGSPCPDLPSFVALADFLPGGQEPQNAHWHAMSNGKTGESPAQSNGRYQQYVNDQMGSCSCAGLARALHAIQDSFSPAHAGFQPWSGGRFTPPSPVHVYKDSYPSKQTWQQAVNASVSAIRRYKEQCTQCQK
jgi:RHS repeat-associated protein